MLVVNNRVEELPADINGFIVEKRLGTGRFADVVSALEPKSGKTVAVKLARPDESGSSSYSPGEYETGFFPTRALAQMSGAIGNANVNPSELIERQFKTLSSIDDPGWMRVFEMRRFEERAFYTMDLVAGQSMRNLMKTGKLDAKKVLVALAAALGNVIDGSNSIYHGDLKPENIMVNGDKIVIVDPGFFGELPGRDSAGDDVSVTTPQYYPLLQPNDMFAFGVIIIECFAGVQLGNLRESANPEKLQQKLGPCLNAMIETYQRGSNYYLDGIYLLPDVLARDDMGVEVQRVALRCLGLERLADGRLELAPAYESFGTARGELVKALG